MNIAVWIKRFGIAASIGLNILFIGKSVIEKASATQDRIGTLTHEVEVGNFNGAGPYFKLPKGLEVRDASPQGLDAVDLFESHRFSIVVTSESENLVDYSQAAKNGSFGEIYSANWKANHATK